MAKVTGVVRFTGTIDGISFYESKFGWIARKKGGPDPEKMKKSEDFVRVRENGKEFGACGKAVGQIRRALFPFLRVTKDPLLVGRLTKLFITLKSLDSVSKRGLRTIDEGLKHEEGRALLRGFEFNEGALNKDLIKGVYVTRLSKCSIKFKGLSPKNHVVKAKGASHVGLKCVVLGVDLQNKKTEVQQSKEKLLSMKSGAVDFVLQAPVISSEENFRILLMHVIYYQETNGSLYPLSSAETSSLKIVEVG